MSCCWGLPPPAGEALAGVEAEGTGFSGIVLPPVEDGGIRGMPKEPRLQRKAGHAQRQAGTSGCPPRELGSAVTSRLCQAGPRRGPHYRTAL